MVDTIYIDYYLWKAVNNKVKLYRMSMGMASEDCAKKSAENGWE
jgi:hypothetical protein